MGIRQAQDQDHIEMERLRNESNARIADDCCSAADPAFSEGGSELFTFQFYFLSI